MSDHSFPPRRTPEAEQRDRSFIAILDAMLQANETITARAIARQLEGVDHASSITRDSWRNTKLMEWQARQADLRQMIERADKSSKSNLVAALERKDARIRELEDRVALLTASHRAMIHAIGEMGGMRAWSRFFENYQTVQEELQGAKTILEAQNLSVYVDWIVDPQMDRSTVSPETAKILRQRLQKCRSLLYLYSMNSKRSRWMPWELGYFDGYNGTVGVLPIKPDKGLLEFAKEEYLGLYPKVELQERGLFVNRTRDIPVPDNDSKNYRGFSDWVKNEEKLRM